uniref:SP11-44 protein n=1 Tax=Brassica campestris TaxID=3711 RepID=Q8RVY8_BRACM|nr:SP11-44 protein [Brassica rapa]
MRYATSIYNFLTKIHYLCFIFWTLTYVQALDVGPLECPKGVAESGPIRGSCLNSTSAACKTHFRQNVTNCLCINFSNHNRGRINCYCCKVKS